MGGLPLFFSRPVSLERASLLLKKRLTSRPERFLHLLEQVVYRDSGHPYLRLLREAGIEWPDIKREVERGGVEAALEVMFKNGVYLAAEEFKGCRPVVRGRLRMFVRPEYFQTRARASRLTVQSSGTSGSRTPVPLSLAYVRSRAVNALLFLKACRGTHWAHGIWAVPGSSALLYILELAGAGVRTVRWFSHLDPSSSGLHPRYRWSIRGVRWASLLSGLLLPRPVRAPLDAPWPILDWMTEALRKGLTAHLFTYPSSAVRLSLAAEQKGISLAGARLTLTGEPVTRVRLAAIQKSGARIMTRYGAAESGTMGYGCLSAENPDEVHLLADRVALIRCEDGSISEGIPAGGLLVTSLDPAAPFFLLNVSLGDRAVLSNGACGCPLERLGWKFRLHSISSHAKITSEGMTFLKDDVARIVDEVLPRVFGGGPTSYQLVEDDDGQGRPELRLLIHPDVGPVDPKRAVEAFLAALSPGDGVERVMGSLWRDARLIRVERRPPFPTASGKIFPVLPLTSQSSRPGSLADSNLREAQLNARRDG